MKIIFNNEPLIFADQLSLTQLLAECGLVETHFAVAVNKTFIPRGFYATTVIHEGDVIDIITPMQGG